MNIIRPSTTIPNLVTLTMDTPGTGAGSCNQSTPINNTTCCNYTTNQLKKTRAASTLIKPSYYQSNSQYLKNKLNDREQNCNIVKSDKDAQSGNAYIFNKSVTLAKQALYESRKQANFLNTSCRPNDPFVYKAKHTVCTASN